jgi:hypothetical protein
MITTRRIGLVTLVLAWAAPLAAQPAAAGRVKTATGSVSIVRGTTVIPVQPGQILLPGDGLRTGADGRVGVTLKDETRLSLGPNSDIHLDQFVYAPGQGRLRFALKIVSGVMAYVSGRIAKLSPDAVRLETPSAILGVRGTRLVIRVQAP